MKALEGLKILDFTTLLPGPYATLMLADLGAEVLKVSAPNRKDLVRDWPPKVSDELSASAAWLGRNKKTIFLNLKKEKSVAAVKKLIMDYDIIIEQFRPGVMKKMGLDYESLKSVNPKIIYCSLTGYGQTGPLKNRAGHDINYLARSGLMASSGRKATGPVLYNAQLADVACGSMNSIVGILAAVHYRDHTGIGQYIDISMQDGLIPLNAMDGASALAGAESPKREECTLNGGGIYDFYQTSDGQYISIGSLEPKFFKNLCQAIQHPELENEKDMDKVKATIKETIQSKTLSEWASIFAQTDACVEPVQSFDEVVHDKHLRQRHMFCTVQIPNTNKSIQQMANPIHLSNTPPVYAEAGYPEGYHTQEILHALGYSDTDVKEMIAYE